MREEVVQTTFDTNATNEGESYGMDEEVRTKDRHMRKDPKSRTSDATWIDKLLDGGGGEGENGVRGARINERKIRN